MENTATIITLEDRGRKSTFVVRPMRALQLETWLQDAAKALPADQTEEIQENSLAVAEYIWNLGSFALACATGEKGIPLLESLLNCCTHIDEDSGTQISCTSSHINDLVGDVLTLLMLRKNAFDANLSFIADTARKTPNLPLKAAYTRAIGQYTPAKVVNLPPVTASVISQGLASLQDLRTTYTFPDALNLIEVANVRKYNQWAQEEAKRKLRHGV